ncbi:MAG: polysaccharide biosynthesis protein [Lachnospiraceae bacterium]|nr:polysaccharide biosynthesis protein [Lachnospiraceae bacterium]
MSRVKFAAKNIAFGYLGNLITGLLNFALRQIFIFYLGNVLNGVNALYTGILSVLSLAELGVGTALNYSLYAPVARKETEKIKAYMQLYKKAYLTIGFVIAVIGISISPFLPYLVKGADLPNRDLTLYYFIFLFNTVSTYFVAFKFSLVNAEQKNYIQTNIFTVTKIITVVAQIIVIIVTRNYYWFLLTQAVVELSQKIFASWYLNRLYPYLRGLRIFGKTPRVTALSREETSVVIRKTKALMLHKIGDTARLQTDSMIISAFINVTITGFVSNYNLVINFVSNFVNVIFNSVISSFGNLIATESKEKQFLMFRIYRFFACWIYGFTAVGFFVLLTPFVNLWLGPEPLLGTAVVYMMLVEYYFKGDRLVLSNFKTAAGVFEQDKYLPLIQGVVSLIISLSLVHSLGLIGVFTGMVISGLIANFVRPWIIYRVCFDMKATRYFIDWLKYLIVTMIALSICQTAGCFIMRDNLGILTFAVTAIIITIVFNGIFAALFCRSEEFKYLMLMFKEKRNRSVDNG